MSQNSQVKQILPPRVLSKWWVGSRLTRSCMDWALKRPQTAQKSQKISQINQSILTYTERQYQTSTNTARCLQTLQENPPGWQMLRERRSGAPRKVRVFYERKDPQHTLFCRETYYCLDLRLFLKGFHKAFNESHPAFDECNLAFVELSKKAILLS